MDKYSLFFGSGGFIVMVLFLSAMFFSEQQVSWSGEASQKILTIKTNDSVFVFDHNLIIIFRGKK